MLLLKSVYTDRETVLVLTELKLSLQNLFGKMADVLEKIKKWVQKCIVFY